VHHEAQRILALKELLARAPAPVVGAQVQHQVEQHVAQVREYFKAPERRSLLLPTVWMLTYEVRAETVFSLHRLVLTLAPHTVAPPRCARLPAPSVR
jgi:hypothetical protein